MLNLKFADAFVELSLRTGQYDSGMKRVRSDLAKTPGTVTIALALNAGQFNRQMIAVRQQLAALRTFPVRLTVDRLGMAASLGLVRQQMTGMTRRSFGTIPIRADLRPWRAAMKTVAFDLYRVRAFAAIPVGMNASAAHSNLNLLMQHLRAAQALTRFNARTNRVGGFGGTGGGSGLGGFGGFLTGVGMGAGLPFSMNPAMMAGQLVGSGAVESVKTAAHLEGEFATLQRVTGLTADQMKRFKESLMGMATSRPGVSTQDLVEMAQIGGRAGVADREGVGGLERFTEDLARVKLAVTDVPTEELANKITRVLNVFELGTNRVAGFGSALTALDNISTASARDILDITTRISGTAAVIGLTLPQVAALSSVLKDVGAQNEVAGTAMTQIFRKMATDADAFANKVGIGAKEFADAYRGDPLKALELVIRKLNELDDTVESQQFLDELKLKGMRSAGTFQQLAQKIGEVRKRAALAAAETGSLSALSGAGRIMGATTGAEFQRAGNAIVELKDAVGGLLAPQARGGAVILREVAGSLASILRGSNQVSFAAQGGPLKAALPALPAVKAPPAPPLKAIDEGEAAVDAAKKKLDQATDLAGLAKRRAAARRVQANEAMAGARNDGELNAAIAMFRGVEVAEKQAVEAAGEMKAAGVALADAMKRLDDFKAKAAKAESDADARDRSAGAFRGIARAFDGQQLGGALGALLHGGGQMLGVAGNGVELAKRIGEQAKRSQPSLGIGLSGAELGRRIQEDIFRQHEKSKDDESTRQTAVNTRDANKILSDMLLTLRGMAKNAKDAILPP